MDFIYGILALIVMWWLGISGIAGLAALGFAYIAYEAFQEYKMSDEEYIRQKQEKKGNGEPVDASSKPGKGMVAGLAVLALICGGIAGMTYSPKQDAKQAEQETKRSADGKEGELSAEKAEAARKKAAEEAEQRRIEAEEKKNPYYEYRNGDKGLIGYMYWYTIAKTPEVERFPAMRKTIPHDGLISEAQLKNMEWRRVAFKQNMLYPNRYEMSDSGDVLYNGNTSLEIPVISKLPGELTPEGRGIFAKKMPDGRIAPLYIGMVGKGQFQIYGVQFDTVRTPKGYITYLKYEGQFENHQYHGTGNLYEIDTRKMENGIPAIKVSSGNFTKGKKDGDFIEYVGEQVTHSKYRAGAKAE